MTANYCNLQIIQCSQLFCQILNIANSCFKVSAEAFWKFQNLENSAAAGALKLTENHKFLGISWKCEFSVEDGQFHGTRRGHKLINKVGPCSQ